ncbi:coiled-coil-helix-coiled-coil-helix domain-containing protein 7-like [Sorex fumeus]|uniref:coiled-coil-helix-coiled-coil-helix domain-containing protein 7-like n=1 Tax=Sorex fumeus TaxID=62283 RepID=UPI0024ACC509|nr:coiled-coil-helix-coiled-coil-helix domain-containing protein 7-like [Sorex fumeus]
MEEKHSSCLTTSWECIHSYILAVCLELDTVWVQVRAASRVLPAWRRGFGIPLVARRLRDPDINPCLSESDASTRRMNENNYDKERCSTYFMRYKNCRKFWNSIMAQRDKME